jgi:hypothetical protein
MRKVLLFVLFTSSTFQLCAQLLKNIPVQISTTEPVFNADYIRSKHIRSVTADIVLKPDNRTIQDKGIINRFEFDSLGRISRFLYTTVKGSSEKEVFHPAVRKKGRIVRKAYTTSQFTYVHDTVSTSFFYDKKNRMKLKRIHDGLYYFAWYYEYDSLGRIIKEIRTKETNGNLMGNDFIIGVQNIISEETYQYEKLTARQVKKLCLNDEGRMYKYVILNYNEKGELVNEDHQFLVSSIINKYDYLYTEKKQLFEIVHRTNSNGETIAKSLFEYDSRGNFIGEKRFKNSIQLNEISYLFDEKGEYLRSKVNRNFPEKYIEIVKYSYLYY